MIKFHNFGKLQIYFNLRKMSTKSTATGVKRLSPNDPSSFSNPEAVKVAHMHLKWDIDFTKKIISGTVTYRLVPALQGVKNLVLDTRTLGIKAVKDKDGKALSFQLGESLLNFGQPLTIEISDAVNRDPMEITVEYETSPESIALLWLDPEQTAGKQFPYVFSKCEMIRGRSLLPCQDTPFVKSTYSAEVTVPTGLQALMSAHVSDQVSIDGSKKTCKFTQNVPIPSYLIALAVGHIQGKRIGPRSTVWAEPEVLEASAYEFAETEEMLKAAESLMGEYVWGVYDILVMPPAFPSGGMENPNLTFVTPTLLAGDRSLANVVAHEIAHSWTGNLVTNANFEHFWLNEGFTVFAERKILRILQGEKFEHFAYIGGWKELSACIKTLKPDNPMTKLVTDLTGEDPDEHFSTCPYEKGSTFLFYLEQKVGGPAVFGPFFKHYIDTNRYQSIVTDVFKSMFINYFENQGLASSIKDIDWDGWLYSTGMPIVKPELDTSLSDVCTILKNKWLNWDANQPCTFTREDLKPLFSKQIEEFLAQLLDESSPFPLEKVKAMQDAYDMNGYTNSEIRFRFLMLCVKARWKDQVPLVLQFVTEQGRMKFVRPLYREMYEWEDIRPQVIEHFKKTRNCLMGRGALIAKDLHI